MKIAILGAGSWGTAIARAFAGNTKDNIYIWDRDVDVVNSINRSSINPKFFSQILLPKNLVARKDLEFLQEIDLIVPVIPAQAIRQLLKSIKKFRKKDSAFLLCSKGVENESLMFLSDIVDDEIPGAKIAVLSGPNFASEVILDIPSATIIASSDMLLAEKIIHSLFSKTLRCYYSKDVIGVQIVAAVKNVLAIASGISKGLDYGENTKAMIISRGIAEIARIMEELGGDKDTLLGLAGVGDIVLTCSSQTSRNLQFGFRLGKGDSVVAAMQGNTIEGYYTTKSIYEICRQIKIDSPLINAIYAILYEGLPVEKAVDNLLGRAPALYEFR